MAIAARTATKGTATSGGAFTVTLPTGSTAGDVIVLFVANAGTAGPAAPVGWTRYRNADSAGTLQSITTFTAPFSAGLTTSFTNAASVAAWTCNAFSGANASALTDGAGAASSNTTNNTSIPVGNPTTGAVAGDYEVLGYAWTSAATLTAATGSTIDATQANSTSISCAIGHNNTTSFGASTAAALGNGTLSASNTRKTGVGVFLQALNPIAITAGLGAPVVAGLAPTIQTPQNSNAGKGATVVAGLAPTININPVISAGLGAPIIAGFAPTIQTPQNSTAGKGATIATGLAPTVSINPIINAGVAAAVAAGFAPTIITPQNSAPAVGVVAATGFAPSVQTPQNSSPSVGGLIVTGYAPTLVLPQNASPGAGVWVATGYAPTIETAQNSNPGTGAVTIAGYAPSIQTPQNTGAGVGALIVTGYAPTVDIIAPGISVEVIPGLGELLITGYSPEIYIGGADDEAVAVPDPTPIISSGGGWSGGSVPGPTIQQMLNKKRRGKGKTKFKLGLSHVIAQVEDLF